MLTYDDTPTIRNAILKRLDTEPGVQVRDLKIAPHLREAPPFIAVGILATIDNGPILRSVFHLPSVWEHRHLLNEIDQIAEQYKAARKDHFGRGFGLIVTPEKQMLGTGFRGLWERYG